MLLSCCWIGKKERWAHVRNVRMTKAAEGLAAAMAKAAEEKFDALAKEQVNKDSRRRTQTCPISRGRQSCNLQVSEERDTFKRTNRHRTVWDKV